MSRSKAGKEERYGDGVFGEHRSAVAEENEDDGGEDGNDSDD